MDNPSVKKSQLNDLMQTAMEKVREMVDTNTIVGQPITTPDGVTLIPISKVSFGKILAAAVLRASRSIRWRFW